MSEQRGRVRTFLRLLFTDGKFALMVIALVIILSSCIATPLVYLHRVSVCESDQGGTWKSTGGLQGLCVADDGRIIP